MPSTMVVSSFHGCGTTIAATNRENGRWDSEAVWTLTCTVSKRDTARYGTPILLLPSKESESSKMSVEHTCGFYCISGA